MVRADRWCCRRWCGVLACVLPVCLLTSAVGWQDGTPPGRLPPDLLVSVYRAGSAAGWGVARANAKGSFELVLQGARSPAWLPGRDRWACVRNGRFCVVDAATNSVVYRGERVTGFPSVRRPFLPLPGGTHALILDPVDADKWLGEISRVRRVSCAEGASADGVEGIASALEAAGEEALSRAVRETADVPPDPRDAGGLFAKPIPVPAWGVLDMDLSPDGRQLALVCGAAIGDVGVVRSGLLVVREGTPLEFVRPETPLPGGIVLNPRWIGSTGRLAYDVVDVAAPRRTGYIWDSATDETEEWHLTRDPGSNYPLPEADEGVCLIAAAPSGHHVLLGGSRGGGPWDTTYLCTGDGSMLESHGGRGARGAAWAPEERRYAILDTLCSDTRPPLFTSAANVQLLARAVTPTDWRGALWLAGDPEDPRDDPMVPYEVAW